MTPSITAEGAPSELLKLLDARGARRHAHTGGRTLADHLAGTFKVLAAWAQPERLRLAGLFHSCYGTVSFHQALFGLTERDTVREAIGREAEELAFWFCRLDRRRFLSGLSRLGLIEEPGAQAVDFQSGEATLIPPRLSADLVILEMANHADQSIDDGAWPGVGLAMLSRLGRLARSAAEVMPPIFDGCTALLTPEAEEAGRASYRAAVSQMSEDPERARALAAEAVEHLPWLGEPMIVLSLLALASGDRGEAQRLSALGASRLRSWGTAWDKRRSWDDWLSLAERILRLARLGQERGVDPTVAPQERMNEHEP